MRSASWLLRTLLIALVACAILVPEAVASKRGRKRPAKRRADSSVYKKYRQTYASALVVEAESGQVLFEKNPDDLRAPASLAKMMTELIALESIERGLISLTDTVEVPSCVRAVRGTRVRLRPEETLPLVEVLHAMAISSANDAALTLACHIAGSEERFVRIMNQRARELGMRSTRFVNPHGLDRNDQPGSITTARDLSVLARELLLHPMAIEISSTVADTIRGCQVIHTTNRLLGTCDGVDGLKTGYTGRAGFCLVSTAERGNLRVVSVLLGATSNRRRFSESAGLIASAYERFRKISIIRKGQDLGKACVISDGSTPQVRLVAGENVAVLLPASNSREIKMEVDAPPVIVPPIEAGAPIGLLRVLVGDSLAAQVPAVAARAVRKANVFERLGLKFGLPD